MEIYELKWVRWGKIYFELGRLGQPRTKISCTGTTSRTYEARYRTILIWSCPCLEISENIGTVHLYNMREENNKKLCTSQLTRNKEWRKKVSGFFKTSRFTGGIYRKRLFLYDVKLMISELNIAKLNWFIGWLTFLVHPGQFQSHRCSASISPPVNTIEINPKNYTLKTFLPISGPARKLLLLIWLPCFWLSN